MKTSTEMRWIPASECGPTERGEYLVHTHTGNRTILAWTGYDWLDTLDTIPCGDRDYWNRQVLHWMPMPEAPK